jgi:serine/threonine protein kinase
VKAANLLIDDDGTVLLGDLGVAVSLDDSNHTSQRSRPKIGKRKSFVGTVSLRSTGVHSLFIYTCKALLDVSGAHTRPTIRRRIRYMVFWHHRP